MPQITTSIANFDDPAHAQAIVDIINSYAIEPHGGERVLPEEISSKIVPGMKATPGAFTMFAWDGEVPVGAAICFQGFTTFAAKPLVNIHDLAVLPAYRGQGIGTMLLEAVETHAKSLGCCKVTLEVRKANPQAEKLYLRVGYGDPDGFETRFLDKKL
ncbi:GNAT family N-acetyltransferase [Thalassoglobus polymorphus]|uniref:Putative acetyltransferase n=1 Tax=Thalassoglobus polymorphus TaxID=2527994 RepID=A0A517QTW9_9PLAN|nr:GNAT family N-acetyltransferase [Thalassoglobus polymorphus]QDT35089.1 putative acetyltransferase [Thalassoglobus polymorphus]